MEIERKFLIKTLPDGLENYPCLLIEQGYLCTNPVVRVRRQNDDYYLTYKGKGLLAHEEYNLPLEQKSYQHLKNKCDGNIIFKKRYLIPYGSLTIELDFFQAPLSLVMAEVEFDSIEAADAFQVPDWFAEDVTQNPAYYNSYLSRKTF